MMFVVFAASEDKDALLERSAVIDGSDSGSSSSWNLNFFKSTIAAL